MRVHLTLIGWFNLVLGFCHTITGLFAAFGMTYLASMFHNADFSSTQTHGKGDAFDPFVPGMFGTALTFASVVAMMLVVLLGLIPFFAGLGLVRGKPGVRNLAILASVLHCCFLVNPLSIALGIYGLVILMNAETSQIFRDARASGSLPAA